MWLNLALDGGDQTRFINSLRKIGLSDQEIARLRRGSRVEQRK